MENTEAGVLPGAMEGEQTQNPTRAGMSRKATLTLYIVTFVLAVWAWKVVLRDPVYQNMTRRVIANWVPQPVMAMPDPTALEAKDPAVGSALPVIGAGKEIRRKIRYNPNGYLVAAFGDCSECTMLDLRKLYAQARTRHITLLAFSTSESAKVAQTALIYSREGIEIPFFVDTNSKLSAALNRYYSGRLYYFTPDWKIRWRERGMGIDNYLFSTGRFDKILENTKP